MFTPKQAAGTASRFRRKGLRGSALDLVSALSAIAPVGISLLEVGGGVGQIQVALLDSGVASTAVNVELSTSWEDAAQTLLEERSLEGRVDRVVGDFVDQAETLPKADAVVLHRVVCCYPDWAALLSASSSKANHLVALTFPSDKLWIRAGIRMVNQICRIRRQSFRAYVHSPVSMIELLQSAGFAVVHDQSRAVWRTVVAARDGREATRSAEAATTSSVASSAASV
jgi:hypothetical protein